MIDFLNSVKSLIKLEHIYTDNVIFKLHYKFTVIMLIIFSILLTSKQYFGEPISCEVDSTMNKDHVDLYCWMHGTFTVKTNWDNTILKGIGNEYYDSKNHQSTDEEEVKVWHKYYQWVCIVFCFQALLFYVPRYIWKAWEAGRVSKLVSNLAGPLVTSNWNHEVKGKLVRYLMSGRSSHTLYAVRFTICEMLNLCNVIFQIYFMDWFLTGRFSSYGSTIFSMKNLETMDQIFPKQSKCIYYNTGPGGSLQKRDGFCLLPLNVLNEKLFLILWIWFYFLTGLTVVSLVFRMMVICLPKIRSYMFVGHCRFIGCKKAYALVKEISYGDFFILDLLGKNVNPVVFEELIEGVYEYLKNNRKIYKAFPTGIIDI